MLCLSGFELYSRWVPLRKILEVGSSILALYVVCIRFTCKGSSLSLLAEGQEDHVTSKILALLAQCKPGADYRLLCKLISLERFFVLFCFQQMLFMYLSCPATTSFPAICGARYLTPCAYQKIRLFWLWLFLVVNPSIRQARVQGVIFNL